MKKEEFLEKLRKNLSVLEEREVQDIVEEYEQHIDMKMKEGLSEEAAIQDFGDLKELTAGILEAYHVKSDYQAEKKNLDFDKVKEESRKATEKATNVIGKGAGALGKGAGALGRGIGAAGKWGLCQMKKLWGFLKWPFIQLKKKLHAGRKDTQGKGFLGRLWLLFLGLCKLVWQCIAGCICLCWNLFWIFMSIFFGIGTLGCIFFLGVLMVLLAMGYPMVGMTMVVIGFGLVSSAVMLFSFTLLKKKANQEDAGDITKDSDTTDSHKEDTAEETDWEYPEDSQSEVKQITVNSYQEVLNNA